MCQMLDSMFGMKSDLEITERIDTIKEAILFWSQVLENHEAKLLFWLIANTILRGNADGSYSLKQICEGIPNRKTNGDWWCGGVGMSRSTVRRAIESLRDKGLITTRQEQRGTRFTVNLEWDFEQWPLAGKKDG